MLYYLACYQLLKNNEQSVNKLKEIENRFLEVAEKLKFNLFNSNYLQEYLY